MNWSLVLNMLSRILMLYAPPAAVGALWAAMIGQSSLAVLFGITCLVTSVMAAVLYISAEKSGHRAGVKEAVALLFGAWLALAALGALPFYLAVNGDFNVAFFEAVSCSTTTGTSLLPPSTTLPAPLIFWRGVLHLFGAAVSIAGTILLLSILSSGATARPGSMIQTGIRFHFNAFPKNLLLIIVLLIALCVLTFLALIVDGLSNREAFSLSVGAWTTGQVWPEHQVQFIDTHISGVLLTIVLLVASLNMSLLLAFHSNARKLLADRETIGLAVAFFILTCLIAASIPGLQIVRAMTEAASIISTSGLLMNDKSLTHIGIPTAVFFGFVGGSAVSSTGGIKIYRMSVLMSQAAHEINRLSQPNAIIGQKKTSPATNVQSVMSVWVYLLGFAGMSALLASYFSLVGFEFDISILLSVGALTNSDALFRPELLDGAHSWATTLLLTIGMLFGRLELLILLAIFVRN